MTGDGSQGASAVVEESDSFFSLSFVCRGSRLSVCSLSTGVLRYVYVHVYMYIIDMWVCGVSQARSGCS